MTTSFVICMLVIVVLHWPYSWERQWDSKGRESGMVRATVYQYIYGPTYDRLSYHGLQWIQRWLLLVGIAVVRQLQPDTIIVIIMVLRQWLG